jgi:hypothetical protein
MSCADVQTIQAGNGSKTLFSFDFPYLFKSEIEVSFWNATTKEWDVKATTDATYPWQVTDANPTIVEFTSTAPPSPATPTDPGEPTVDNVRIRRNTSIADIRALFSPGSAIRSDDLNKNFEQLRYAIQESNCEGISDEVYQYLLDYYWDRFDNTLYSADTWRSDDATIATTAALDQRFQDEAQETIESTETWVSDDDRVPTTLASDNRVDSKIDDAITNDIGTDGTGITVTDDGDGTITLGLGVGSIDIDRIKAGDIITYAEQNAGSPAWESDDQLATTWAAAKRFDTLVQTATPTGSDWQIGKTWLQNDTDKTLSIWNGSSWIGVASGGTFTTQPTVIYVDSVNGNDANDGHRIISPKQTIKNAVQSANAGDIILVNPGVYQEALPIDVTVDNLSIVGQSIRSCFIHPTVATETETMFRCNSGTYITGFTFAGLKANGVRGGHPVDTDVTYGLPANQGWVAGFYPNANIRKSPYIQNCTNFADSGIDNSNFNPNNFPGTGGDLTSAPTGGGIFVDGSLPAAYSPLRSIVVDSFTQICLDGPGCLVANNGYAQLVSFFGTFCHYHTKALNGGQANLTNSTTDFGRYGLIADGKSSSAIFTSTANGAASAGDITFAINEPTDTWFGTATRPLDNMLVQIGSDIYEILSSSPNGLGWNVTISNPNPANRAENLGLDNPHSNGVAVSFFLQSFVSTSGHTFEYAGTGTDYRALPQNGGVAIEASQVISRNNGRVWLSSTDQNGKFKVGDTFAVDQRTGFVTIDPQAVAINVVSDLTPQLGGDLDVLNRQIYTSLTNGAINVNADGSGDVNITTPSGDINLSSNAGGLIQATEFNLSQVPIVTQHDIGTAANEVPLNGMLGGMAFQDPANVLVDELVIDSGVLVANLPAGPIGTIKRVTDATAPAVGSTVTGGGAAPALCWYNGTNWTVIGV